MKIKLTKDDEEQLLAFLRENEDCEEIGAGEFIADIYDGAEPVTLDITAGAGAAEVIAAARLIYSESDDAYYMGEQTDSQAAFDALKRAAGLED